MGKKLPSFQFYPGDWMKDPNLARCSLAAQGLWMRILCLLFEAESRGEGRTKNVAWSYAEIARAAGGGVDVRTGVRYVQELVDKGVAKTAEDGAIYSKRLIEDEERRVKGRVSGEKGAKKRWQNGSSSSSSSSSDKKENKKKKKGKQPNGVYSPAFEEFWEACPRRVGKGNAWKAWTPALEAAAQSPKKIAGESVEEFLARRMRDYAAFMADKDAQFVRHPSTWLNGGNWDDEVGSRVPTDEDLERWRP